MRPFFDMVTRHYPKSEKQEALYKRLGWDDLIENPAYKDTCAIRMSLALSLAGVPLPGASMRPKAPSMIDIRIEPRQRKLSDILKQMWGKPEVYDSESAAQKGIGKRKGVVSFFRISGGSGGHIDLVYPGPYGFLECARSCFFGCLEIWFWPLE